MPKCPNCGRWIAPYIGSKDAFECRRCGSTLYEPKRRRFIVRLIFFNVIFFIPFILGFFIEGMYVVATITIILAVLFFEFSTKYEVESKENMNSFKKPWE